MANLQASPEMLVLARESRGLRQGEMAAAMTKASGGAEKVSQGYVSRAEAGQLTVSGDRLELYARALAYPEQLLCLGPGSAQIGVGLVHHRKKAALSAPALRCVHAQLALAQLQVEGLLRAAGRSFTSDRISAIEIDALTTPTDAAGEVRTTWGLPRGPVPDLIGAIERAGAVVLTRDLGSDLLDAVSLRTADGAALLLVNNRAPGDRLRFSLAHELGHLVMHHAPGDGKLQEKQADRFASAFLMPADDIRDAFAGGVSLARLAELKERWRVSMGALLRRARDLDRITEWQYRNVTVEMSALGYRTAEPVDVPREQPHRMDEAVQSLIHRYELSEVATMAYLLPDDFLQHYPLSESTV